MVINGDFPTLNDGLKKTRQDVDNRNRAVAQKSKEEQAADNINAKMSGEGSQADFDEAVSISEEEYIYTMGNEAGIVVNLINYPRFPKEPHVLLNQAIELAELLIVKLHQGSCTVVDHNRDSHFISRRDD